MAVTKEDLVAPAERPARLTVPMLHQYKRDGRKLVGVVVWDYQMAQIVDRVGVELVSVGDSVGTNLWGHANPLAVTMEQMLVVCQAAPAAGRAPSHCTRLGWSAASRATMAADSASRATTLMRRSSTIGTSIR